MGTLQLSNFDYCYVLCLPVVKVAMQSHYVYGHPCLAYALVLQRYCSTTIDTLIIKTLIKQYISLFDTYLIRSLASCENIQ